jgi:hypothetical protein
MSAPKYYRLEPCGKTQEVVVDTLVAAVVKAFVAVLGLVLALTSRRLGGANHEALTAFRG